MKKNLCPSRRHIVFLDQYGELGGGQQVLLELARAAIAEGMTVTVLIPDGPCVAALSALGARTLLIPELRLSQGEKSIADMARISGHGLAVFARQLDALRTADLIYVNGNRLFPVALLAETLLGKNAVFHIHLNHGATERQLFLRLLRLRRTRALVVPSAFIRRELVAFDRGFDQPRLKLAQNGLDARFAAIPYEDVFSARPLRQVAVVGRISPEKGQDVLPLLARMFPQLTFHVLGDAAFSGQAYERKVRECAPENIIFHGWVDDIPARARALGIQLCLVPSRVPEAAPLVPLQMTALGCLTLVRRVGALEDLSGELGLPHFCTDEELPGCLRQLLESPAALLASQSRAAWDKVTEGYDHEAFHQRLRALLTALTEEK